MGYFTQPEDRGDGTDFRHPAGPCLAGSWSTDCLENLRSTYHICALPRGHARLTHICVSCLVAEWRDKSEGVVT